MTNPLDGNTTHPNNAMPETLTTTEEPVYAAIPNDGDLASCIGAWPGDETDAELLQSLKDIR
jgi:hypothetical protein